MYARLFYKFKNVKYLDKNTQQSRKTLIIIKVGSGMKRCIS